VKGAAGAVQGAYQSGASAAAIKNVSSEIQSTIQTVDKASQTVAKTDPNMATTLDNVKAGLQSAADALSEGTKPKQWRRKRK
jgi:gas vesicle protein